MSEEFARKEIIEEKLDEITGGKYSAEAQEWVVKYRKEVTKRAKECGFITTAKFAAMDIKFASKNEEVSLETLKKALTDLGINVSDLD